MNALLARARGRKSDDIPRDEGGRFLPGGDGGDSGGGGGGVDSGYDAHQASLATSEIVSSTPKSGGSSYGERVVLASGQTALIKESSFGGEGGAREIAAYELSKEVGVDVPATAEREIKGSPGSIQEWRGDGVSPWDANVSPDLSSRDGDNGTWAQERDKAAAFDYVTQQGDRSAGNLLVSKSGGVILIDNEQSMMKFHSPHYAKWGTDKTPDAKIPDSVKGAWAKVDWNKVGPRMVAVGLKEHHVQIMRARSAALVNATTWGEAHGAFKK